jgi:hypothetical protein
MAVLMIGMLAGATGAQAKKPTVKLLFPVEGAVVPVGEITIRMTVAGAQIAPADETHVARTGHFHLYLDKVPEHVGRPIPKGVEGIVHTAETSYKLKVTQGIHTLVLLWAHGDHIPFNPWVSDTVMFEAR